MRVLLKLKEQSVQIMVTVLLARVHVADSSGNIRDRSINEVNFQEIAPQ